MVGETDLGAILRSLKVKRRQDPVVVVTTDQPPEIGDGVDAVVHEEAGYTAIATVAAAEQRGWPTTPQFAWLTINVHTSLEGVGLTAAMSRVLADHQIPCNVVAGYFHDHLLVPLPLADDAIAVLESLANADTQ